MKTYVQAEIKTDMETEIWKLVAEVLITRYRYILHLLTISQFAPLKGITN